MDVENQAVCENVRSSVLNLQVRVKLNKLHGCFGIGTSCSCLPLPQEIGRTINWRYILVIVDSVGDVALTVHIALWWFPWGFFNRQSLS